MFRSLMQRAGGVFLNVFLTLGVLGVVIGTYAAAQSASCPPGTCPTIPAGFPETCCNGDINGDASINIADPVALLAYLFSGGPAPAAIAAGPATGGSSLTATMSASQSIPGDNSPVTIPFDQDSNDTLGEFANGVFSPAEAGTYLVQLQLGFTNVPSGGIVQLGGALNVNGFAEVQDRRNVTNVFNVQSVSTSKVLDLVPGDTVTAIVSAGVVPSGTVSLNSGPVLTFLQVTRLR